MKKEIEDRDRINNNLQLQLSKQRANPAINPNIDLKNRVVELEVSTLLGAHPFSRAHVPLKCAHVNFLRTLSFCRRSR